MRQQKTVRNGCDRLCSDEARTLLAGRKLGLITNASGVTRELRTTSSELVRLGYDLRALFGPEHGVRTAMQAGYSENAVYTDPETGVPVYDLFGSAEEQEKAHTAMRELDIILFDIQDIGVRYYTYQYTMAREMRFCAEAGLPFAVLDRVNPLGGVRVDGNVLEAGCESFVGMFSIPARPGMTVGELARYFNTEENIGCSLYVIPCEGWSRELYFDDTDLPFVLPSPNMPTLDTVIVYPGTCFLEGTALSEGRGTTKPFELFGAPWLDTDALLDAAKDIPTGGFLLRPCAFTPVFSKHAGTLCNGVQVHVTDREAFDAYVFGLYLLVILRRLHPDKCAFSKGLPHLVGTQKILDPAFDPAAYLAEQEKERRAFAEKRKPYLLY